MNTLQEALRQVWEGADFMPPEKLLATVKPEAAAAKHEGFPYSIATNVAHADIWNRLWLATLEGKGRFNPFPDFPSVSAKEWPAVRKRFLANLNRAYQIASGEPLKHKMRSDDSATRTLLKIAVHTSYHLGQIKLLMRLMRKR